MERPSGGRARGEPREPRAPRPPAARRRLTLTIVETNSSTSTATWRTIIPSSRSSILAVSSAQRSLCLAGERAELDVRPSEPACASERARQERKEGGKEGGTRREGPALGRPGPGAAPGRPPRPATAERGQQPTAASPPRSPSSPPATELLLLLEQNKWYARRTSKSPREARFFQSAKQRPQRASAHLGAPGAAQRGEGGRRARARVPPWGAGGERKGPRFLREARGRQRRAGRESARREAGFPDPRTLRIPLDSQVSTQFLPRRGAGPAPAQLGIDTSGPGEKAQSGVERRGKDGRRELLGPAPPAHRARFPRQPCGPGRCAPGTGAQEPGWRGASVRWEGEAEGTGWVPGEAQPDGAGRTSSLRHGVVLAPHFADFRD